MFVEPKSTPSPPKELWGFQTFFSNEIWESLLLRAGINFRMRIQARPGCAVTSAVTLHQEHIPCKWLPAGIRFIPKSTDVFSAGLGSQKEDFFIPNSLALTRAPCSVTPLEVQLAKDAMK